jgi:hypothetical protein
VKARGVGDEAVGGLGMLCAARWSGQVARASVCSAASVRRPTVTLEPQTRRARARRLDGSRATPWGPRHRWRRRRSRTGRQLGSLALATRRSLSVASRSSPGFAPRKPLAVRADEAACGASRSPLPLVLNTEAGTPMDHAGKLFDEMPRPCGRRQGRARCARRLSRPSTASSARADGAHGAELGALAR